MRSDCTCGFKNMYLALGAVERMTQSESRPTDRRNEFPRVNFVQSVMPAGNGNWGVNTRVQMP